VIFVEQAQQLMAERPINEQVLEKAAEIASGSCKPIDDIRASARYRREMVRTLTHRALQEVCAALQEKNLMEI
jgi:carbon-monoxide dehydrogenase medium subunit